MHTFRETFDTSCLALIAQGRPGWDNVAQCCSYSAGCAAAHLLPPDADRCAMDAAQCMADRDIVADALRRNGYDPVFVCCLQQAHDVAVVDIMHDENDVQRTDEAVTMAWRWRWLPRVRDLAAKYGLSFDRVREAARLADWDLACIAQ